LYWLRHDDGFASDVIDYYNVGGEEENIYALQWSDLVGTQIFHEAGDDFASYNYDRDFTTSNVSNTRDWHVSVRDAVLLHYTLDERFDGNLNFQYPGDEINQDTNPERIDLSDPAEAAEWAIIGEPYENPVDCVLSEWSDWGLCVYADDCIKSDYYLQTRIRTREITTPASGGGVCHLPIVEDFYRFTHRSAESNDVAFNEDVGNGFYWLNSSQVSGNGPSDWLNRGADYQHGGGFAVRVDYTNRGAIKDPVFKISKINLWDPRLWAVDWVNDISLNTNADVSNPRILSWTVLSRLVLTLLSLARLVISLLLRTTMVASSLAPLSRLALRSTLTSSLRSVAISPSGPSGRAALPIAMVIGPVVSVSASVRFTVVR